ncbi:alpha,alpha-trehalase nth1 [Pichia californica]|uniref:Trehalase n=1 Tax=Pichia californica TaxID=460514 RepID=A0A9P7BE99_9ASCO|nr:alpha,alpha-trehalase nth1 [[Candida] californica]KAG0687661.1 alpha,alpha-trehalase nth1 [[Candida] californica]
MLNDSSQSKKSHRRKSSVKVDPFESSDLYYGPITDPSNVNTSFGRLRTRSVITPKPKYHSFGNSLTSFSNDSEDNDSNSGSGRLSRANFHIHNDDDHDNHLESIINSKITGKEYSNNNHYLNLKNLRDLNKSSSSTNIPVISDSDNEINNHTDLESDVSDDNDDKDDLYAVSMKSHSTGSLVAESDIALSNENFAEPTEYGNTSIMKPKFKTSLKSKKLDSVKSTIFPNSTESSSTSSFKSNVPLPSTNTRGNSLIPNRDTFSPSPSPSTPTIRRRGSADMSSSTINSKRFFISDIDATLNELLTNEDTDQNCQITIDDKGPKVLKLGTANSAGFNQYDIRGTYMLSNLLQELTIAKRFGRKQMILDEARLNENPVSRLYRLITTSFWKNLTRQVTETSILEMAKDTKISSEGAKYPRIYIPYDEAEQFYYYSKISEKYDSFNLKVEYLPKIITDDYVKSINDYPGLLALAVRHKSDKYGDLEGYQYVVPGGRFNEQYGWDSYFETLGLLSCNILEPCIGMCENFIFEINHYGKILNANRSYYLCRSQPPFLTDMTLRIFDYMKEKSNNLDIDFLKRAFLAAIKEYNEVWTSYPRLDPITGLSTYHPSGKGIPPETEASHFISVLTPYCEKYELSFDELQEKYNNGLIEEPELDEYFLHDRAVRESGHDTSYRLEGICANLATIDLNCLLFKYEKDISFVIKTYFNNELEYNGSIETSEKWEKLAEIRRGLIDKYMWNEKNSLYYDYNIKIKGQSNYESVTAFYALWAGVCTPERAKILIENSLHKFEEFGGLVSGTKKSRGDLGVSKPSRQWDYPFAWAPHQILTWDGLKKYNRKDIAQRLSYRWLYLMTLSFVDFNGIVVEKYDATSERQPHKVEAEYGNQGSGFKGVATEGFGWVNASYLLGLKNLDILSKRALGMVTSPTDFFAKMNPTEKTKYGLAV